jgi:glucosamine 6-phosphate synthetase-like amidotransferase/phosphosugar isomerase protein
MCGIFGFMLSKTVPINSVFSILEKLEAHQYPQEPNPLGGYGAGLAILLDDGRVISDKVGKGDGSPVNRLARIWGYTVREASVLIGHVRMPSPEFMNSASLKETAQPYVVRFDPSLTIVSVHNGKVENYEKLRAGLGKRHTFESENIQLIDSEIIPHYFEELLNETKDVDEALSELLCRLQGSNTVSMLQVRGENSLMHLVHKGKTRGLVVWANDHSEAVFCSRKEVLTHEFRKVLAQGNFKIKASIEYHEEAALRLSFSRELK